MEPRPDYYARLFYAAKVMLWPLIGEEVEVQRALGSPIVLTNGVFDILHPGHLLKVASCRRSRADFLIVSVDTDENVLAYKGRMPVLTAWDRAAIVAAVYGVDAVTFHGAGYGALGGLLRALRPDRWYRREDAPQAEDAAARAAGCEIVRSSRNGGWSSTALRRG